MHIDCGRARIEGDVTRTANATRQDGREARCRVRLRGLWGYSSGGPRPVQLYETAEMEVIGTRSMATIERKRTGARTACALCASGAPLKANAWHSGHVELLSPRVRLEGSSLSLGKLDGCADPSKDRAALPGAECGGT